MRRWIFSVVLALSIISISERVFAQIYNTFPLTGPAGIGTMVTGMTTPENALHLNCSSSTGFDTAIIRLSNDAPLSTVFGIIGLMPFSMDTTYSSISTGEDLIIHEHSQGDIILTNYQSTSLSHPYGAIRFATTPASSTLPLVAPPLHDIERMTISPTGNIGIDLAPDAGIFAGLGNPKDQLQIGGGSIPPPGYLDPVPGLTLYGGNRFEGMAESGLGAGLFPVDWRYIGFNFGINHAVTDSTRFFRMGRMGASTISFWGGTGGGLQLNAYPYDSIRDAGTAWLHDVTHYLTLNMNGQQGLSLWTYLSDSDAYHHLVDFLLPGYLPPGVTRNTNGLCFHHTPVYICSDTNDNSDGASADFTNFAHVNPDIGDGKTWMLAVNGPALFKEAWVNSSDWPDYVFQHDFKLMSIDDFGNYIRANHHLPELPDAKTMNSCVPLGQTEKELTKQVEEMALYIDQLNKEVEALKADIQDLKKGGK